MSKSERFVKEYKLIKKLYEKGEIDEEEYMDRMAEVAEIEIGLQDEVGKEDEPGDLEEPKD